LSEPHEDAYSVGNNQSIESLNQPEEFFITWSVEVTEQFSGCSLA